MYQTIPSKKKYSLLGVSQIGSTTSGFVALLAVY
jgi:hypothetical protein